MRRRFTISAITALTMMAVMSAVFAGPSLKPAQGAKQISGIGYFDTTGECDDPEGVGASYALTMTGSLTGCHYVFVGDHKCQPGGAYYETGTETFVGWYNGQYGTFTTNYVFTAKYVDCSLTTEVEGRCQHPFTGGSGVFEGVKEARLDMRDDVSAGNFPYKGHIQF